MEIQQWLTAATRRETHPERTAPMGEGAPALEPEPKPDGATRVRAASAAAGDAPEGVVAVAGTNRAARSACFVLIASIPWTTRISPGSDAT